MPRKRMPTPEKHCDQCGQKMERKMYGLALEDMGQFNRRRFCNQKCMAASMEGKIKVLNEISSRKQSAKKNTGTCVKCGRKKKDTRLYVHHKDRNPLNNIADNLETLCGSCHRKEHAPKPKKCDHCDMQARGGGLCNTHRSRRRTHGNPLLTTVWKDGKRISAVAPVRTRVQKS